MSLLLGLQLFLLQSDLKEKKKTKKPIRVKTILLIVTNIVLLKQFYT